jgi:hypothetical protein
MLIVVDQQYPWTCGMDIVVDFFTRTSVLMASPARIR